jgi:outer membrane protein assembly factor BamD
MTVLRLRRYGWPGLAWLLAAGWVLGAGAGCASGPPLPAPGSIDADKFLFQRGTDALQREKWISAREYFRTLIDTYPRSELRKQAKLGLGDTYLGEGRIDSLILAANEFREYLTFFPLDEMADYAQYKLGVALSEQMLGPERDQTATIEALVELERFIKSYPNSKYRPEVDKLWREARDRLSESEFRVGLFHYRSRLYQGALQRFRAVLEADPGYSKKDEVYFHLAETLLKLGQGENGGPTRAEAVAYLSRLIQEFPNSEYVERAEKRLSEIKAAGLTL